MHKYYRPSLGLLVLAGLAFVCGGCDTANGKNQGGPRGNEPSDTSSSLLGGHVFAGESPIDVACTTGMVGDLVRNIGAEHVRVTQLMGEGVDPHLYTANPGDIRILRDSDLIFFSGLHLEGKMSDLFVRMARTKPVFAVTEGVPIERILEVADGLYDPHLWFDVSLWSEAAGVVRDVLGEFDPAHRAEYHDNARAYQAELAALDTYCRESIATIPPEWRVLVTAHDAFHYFGRAYDLEVRAIQGVSTDSEAGLKEINELVDFITQRKIRAVFVETSVSERNIQSLIEGCQARGHNVVKGGELFSDAMGPDGTPEGTYVGMVRHNVDTIVAALK